MRRRRSPAPRAPRRCRAAPEPHGEGDQGAHPADVDAPHEGQPEQAEGNRDDPDVDAEQRHQAKEAGVGLGSFRRHRDLGVDRAARRGQHEDLVGLALDPGIGDLQRGRAETADLLARACREGRESVVDRDLGDFDRVGAVVAQGQLDLTGVQHGAFDCDLLYRRPVAVTEPRAAEQGEGADRGSDQGEWQHAQRPGRQTPLGQPLCPAPRLHQALLPAPPQGSSQYIAAAAALPSRAGSPTRKKPDQPSSANSLTWAWNM